MKNFTFLGGLYAAALATDLSSLRCSNSRLWMHLAADARISGASVLRKATSWTWQRRDGIIALIESRRIFRGLMGKIDLYGNVECIVEVCALDEEFWWGERKVTGESSEPSKIDKKLADETSQSRSEFPDFHAFQLKFQVKFHPHNPFSRPLQHRNTTNLLLCWHAAGKSTCEIRFKQCKKSSKLPTFNFPALIRANLFPLQRLSIQIKWDIRARWPPTPKRGTRLRFEIFSALPREIILTFVQVLRKRKVRKKFCSEKKIL